MMLVCVLYYTVCILSHHHLSLSFTVTSIVSFGQSLLEDIHVLCVLVQISHPHTLTHTTSLIHPHTHPPTHTYTRTDAYSKFGGKKENNRQHNPEIDEATHHLIYNTIPALARRIISYVLYTIPYHTVL